MADDDELLEEVGIGEGPQEEGQGMKHGQPRTRGPSAKGVKLQDKPVAWAKPGKPRAGSFNAKTRWPVVKTRTVKYGVD